MPPISAAEENAAAPGGRWENIEGMAETILQQPSSSEDSDNFLRNPGLFVRYPDWMEQTPSENAKEADYCRHVLITGLGRSGTTALANIFRAFGFHFGETSPFQELPWLRAHLLAQRYDEVGQFLATWQGSGERQAWKDPKLRANRHGTFLAGLPTNIALVASCRDPLATALRVVDTALAEPNEDFFADLNATISQMTKMLVSLRARRERLVLLVSYEKLLTETEQVVRQLARIFHVEDQQKIADAVQVTSVSPLAYRAELALKRRASTDQNAASDEGNG